MNRILKPELLELEQKKVKKEKDNERLEKKLKTYESKLPKNILDVYILENIDGIYIIKDDLGNIVTSLDIENVMEREIFKEAEMSISDYNECYKSISNNNKEIRSIDERIKYINNN